MLRPRIIPCLLVHRKGLVKTVKFKEPRYIGDPLNAVRIFNEKESDELLVLDIDATIENREPDYKLIERLAAECRMPVCYGGGVKTVEQSQRIFALGVEKIAVSSGAIAKPELVSEMAMRVGSQSVVVVMDVKKAILSRKYEVCTHNGKKNTGKNPAKFAADLEKLGAGEIVINSIDRDGMMNGYDISLIESVWNNTSLPVTALGGAGSLKDIANITAKFRNIGAAAGSLFVFKGVYKAVLINYPKWAEKEQL